MPIRCTCGHEDPDEGDNIGTHGENFGLQFAVAHLLENGRKEGRKSAVGHVG